METPPLKSPKNVCLRDDILMALVAPLGFRSEWGALLGYLKIREGATLRIGRSELTFLDADGNIIETRRSPSDKSLTTNRGAFGLACGTELPGPYSDRFSDDCRRPATAVTVRWRVNDMEAEAELVEPEGISLRVIWLPLRVAVKDDPHLVVTVVNRTGQMLNIAEGIRNAACMADGKRFPSNRGGHWDGGAHVQPGKSVTKQFGLGDFPGVPLTGRHEMSLKILGHMSKPEMIEWAGMESVRIFFRPPRQV